MRPERAGFTLIELLVALSLGAMVLVGARTLLEGLAGHAAATVRSAREADDRANAERHLRQVVGNLALAPETQPSLVGTPSEARFASWCPAARGAVEGCGVSLLVEQGVDGPVVRLSLSTGARLTVGRGAPARLRYLADATAGGRWVSRWDALSDPPLAIGVLAGPDTLIIPIGERR